VKLKAARTQSSYAVEVPVRDFPALTRREFDDPCGPDLGTEINKLPGVHSAEYNGHFGSAIYYTVRVEHDNEATHAAVFALIERHMHPRKHGLKRTP
jgi:hypothetical protein